MFDLPGRLYVVATLLPLAAFALLLVGGGVRAACRPFRNQGGLAGNLYWICGGDRPLKSGAYLATFCIGLAAVLAIVGLVQFLTDANEGTLRAARWAERASWVRIGPDAPTPKIWERQTTDQEHPPRLALSLEVGYKIDSLTAVMFAMVTVISTFIFVFSIGYMKDETQEVVEDHEVDRQSPSMALDGLHQHHFHRRGRFGRFFLYLSLFCFSMLNLVIADNLFQIFVSWELVGVCSFFLIGFYYERPSASRAANKAFIVNRIGDAGFLIGILIAWAYCGTLNIEELIHRVRSPEKHIVEERSRPGRPPDIRREAKADFPNMFIRVNPDGPVKNPDSVAVLPPRDRFGTGSYLLLFPLADFEPGNPMTPRYSKDQGPLGDNDMTDRSFETPAKATYLEFGAIPYWLFVVMGIGIFLGCVGKSAQVPLHTWLPDAMEGPTPVSALIHAATMVAAGVYLVGRVFALFAPEVLLVITYTGAVTLFIAATIALVQTDIKRILAYSTCSQLGFMMLALGVGGWVAGLLHLITHAFFKALLFLGSGSVIHGCHHEQDVRKMGGLRHKMPVTALTMLIGVLAICGAPLFSGWYSKDQILAAALGYGLDHRQHVLLLVLPFVTAGMTAFYMFRLWFLTFAGQPRDEHVSDHAHESPWVMTLPLVVLAAFSIGVAWGWPAWDADASYLGSVLAKSQPGAVEVQFHHEHEIAEHNHLAAGIAALVLSLTGFAIAFRYFGMKQPSTAEMYRPGNPIYRFLVGKWYFDEAYDAALVNPTVALARAAAAADKRPTDAPPPVGEAELPPRRFDLFTLDGSINTVGQLFDSIGRSLRMLQSGRLRSYILALALTAAVMLGILTALAK